MEEEQKGLNEDEIAAWRHRLQVQSGCPVKVIDVHPVLEDYTDYSEFPNHLEVWIYLDGDRLPRNDDLRERKVGDLCAQVQDMIMQAGLEPDDVWFDSGGNMAGMRPELMRGNEEELIKDTDCCMRFYFNKDEWTENLKAASSILAVLNPERERGSWQEKLSPRGSGRGREK